jgi:putative FmdB family regulatory protein
MPTYDYACDTCGAFEAFKPMSQRDATTECPRCSRPARRVLVAAARVARPAASGARVDAAAAEGSYRRMRHAAGCACC